MNTQNNKNNQFSSQSNPNTSNPNPNPNFNSNSVSNTKANSSQNQNQDGGNGKNNDQEKKSGKWMTWVLILVVVVLAVGLSLNKGSDSPALDEEFEPCQEGDEFNFETGEPCPVGNQESVESVSTSTLFNGNGSDGTSNYAQALLEYEGRSILFDENCVADPQVLEVRLGSRVLVGNDSTASLESSIQERVEDLRPYHYMLSTSFNVVGEFPVSCNGEEVATVSVE